MAQTKIYRRTIPVFVVSFFMAITLADYYQPKMPIISPLTTTFLAWASMIALLQLAFGYATLVRLHGTRLAGMGATGWTRPIFKSIVVLATFVIFLIIGAMDPRTSNSATFVFWYSNLVSMAGVGATLEWISHYSSPARMFKITSLESATMFVTWLLCCLREMPSVVVYVSQFEQIGDWIMKVPYMASNRGVMIAAGVGIVILSVRALIGQEPGLIEMEVTQ